MKCAVQRDNLKIAKVLVLIVCYCVTVSGTLIGRTNERLKSPGEKFGKTTETGFQRFFLFLLIDKTQ